MNINKKSINNKVVLISGASQGLGAHLTRVFCEKGAHVVAFSRNINTLRENLGSLELEFKPNLNLVKCDVTNDREVDNLISYTINLYKKIDVLINNAGVYGPMGPIEKLNLAEWKQAFDINFYGSVNTIIKTLPYFKKNKSGRIIQLSGGGATSPLPFITSYASSKAAIVRFVESVALEVKRFNITINAIAPGALNTSMLERVLSAGKEKVGEEFYVKALEQKKDGGTPFKYASDLALFLASDHSYDISGKLISAVWDNYKIWPNNKQFLNNSDLYTLRRIIGKDRNFDEGDN